MHAAVCDRRRIVAHLQQRRVLRDRRCRSGGERASHRHAHERQRGGAARGGSDRTDATNGISVLVVENRRRVCVTLHAERIGPIRATAGKRYGHERLALRKRIRAAAVGRRRRRRRHADRRTVHADGDAGRHREKRECGRGRRRPCVGNRCRPRGRRRRRHRDEAAGSWCRRNRRCRRRHGIRGTAATAAGDQQRAGRDQRGKSRKNTHARSLHRRSFAPEAVGSLRLYCAAGKFGSPSASAIAR